LRTETRSPRPKTRNRVAMVIFSFLVTLALACKPTPSVKSAVKATGYALWFDGQDDFLRTDKWLSGTAGGFCIEAWVRPALSNPYANVGSFLVHRAVGHDKRLRYEVEKNAFWFAAMQVPNGDLWVTSGRKVTTGGWHHVATVYDGRAMALYVDGQVVAQTSTTAALDWDTAYQASFIGGDPLPGAAVQGNFRGLLDEVRIWNAPRTADEIRATMKSPVAANTPGLVAYWNFDDGRGQIARDLAGHGHDAQFGSTPDRRPDDPAWIRSDCPISDGAEIGPAGHNLWFSGQGPRLVTMPLDGLRSAKAVTIEAWIRPSSPLSRASLFSIIYSSQGAVELRANLNEDGSLAGLLTGSSGRSLFQTPAVIRPGEWQHVALVFSSNKVSVRVSGRSVCEQNWSDPIALAGERAVVGAAGDGSEPFAGEIDEIRVWNVARSDSEIRDAMNRTISPNEPGLVGYWRLDEGEGKIARDLSPFRAHAQLGNRPVPDMDDPLWLVSDAPVVASAAAETTRPIRQNFALQFDGQDDYADMGNAPDLRLGGPLTIEAWIKPTIIAASGQPILAKENANGRQNAYELLLDHGLARFQVSDGSAGCCGAQGWFPATGKTTFQPNIWRHVAGVWDGRQISVYLDGILEGSRAFDRPIPDVPFSVKVGLNAFSQPKYFAGVIDEVRLWNRARSQAEIFTDMNRSLNGNEPGLIGYWTFDEPGEGGATSSTGQLAFDHSRHQNHGFLGGSIAREAGDPQWVVSDAPVAPWP